MHGFLEVEKERRTRKEKKVPEQSFQTPRTAAFVVGLGCYTADRFMKYKKPKKITYFQSGDF